MEEDEPSQTPRTLKTMTADELKPIIEINSILYIAQYLIKDSSKFITYMEAYNSSTTDLKAARARLLTDYDSQNISYSKPKTEPKTQKKIIEDLKTMLELATQTDPRTKIYVPHPKDGALVFKSPAAMGLDQVSRLTTELVAKLSANPVINVTPSTPTLTTGSASITSHLSVPTGSSRGRTSSRSSRTTSFNRSLSSRSKRNRTDHDAPDETYAEALRAANTTWKAVTSRKKRNRPTVGAGTGVSGLDIAPTRKVAVKIVTSAGANIEKLKQWKNLNNNAFRKHDIKFELMNETEKNKTFRAVCSDWPIGAQSFSEASLWLAGVVVYPWTGPIKSLPPPKMRRFVGNLNAETTAEKLKQAIQTQYDSRGDQVSIVVEDFFSSKPGWVPKTYVKNFVVEISHSENATDGKSVPNHLSFLTEKRAVVRFWGGPMPSKLRARAEGNSTQNTRTASLD